MAERQADPLEALRTPATSIAPHPEFGARLRTRLERALLAPITQEDTMTLSRDDLSRNGTRAGDVSYITLVVPDAARARAFYAAMLGWRFGPGEAEQVDEVIPQVGLSAGGPPGAVLSFRVEDLTGSIATVRGHGGTALDPTQERYGLIAACHDDQGMEFTLHQLPTAGAATPATGTQHGDISYVTLQVADGERAAAFFGAVLGWAFSPGRTPGGYSVEGPTPMFGMAGGRGERPGAVLCYQVDDIDAAVSRVRRAGGTATDPVQRPYARESSGVDDQGIAFYLHQFPG